MLCPHAVIGEKSKNVAREVSFEPNRKNLENVLVHTAIIAASNCLGPDKDGIVAIETGNGRGHHDSGSNNTVSPSKVIESGTLISATGTCDGEKSRKEPDTFAIEVAASATVAGHMDLETARLKRKLAEDPVKPHEDREAHTTSEPTEKSKLRRSACSPKLDTLLKEATDETTLVGSHVLLGTNR